MASRSARTSAAGRAWSWSPLAASPVDLPANPRPPSRARGTCWPSGAPGPLRAVPAARRETARPASAPVPGITFGHSGLGRAPTIIGPAMINGAIMSRAGAAIGGIMAFAPGRWAGGLSVAAEMQDPRLPRLTEHATPGSRPKPQDKAAGVISRAAFLPGAYPAYQR